MSDRSHSSCFRSLAWQNVACAYSVSSLKQIWELDYPPMLSIYSMWNKNIILAAWFSEPHKILLSKHRYDTDLKMKTNVIRVSSMSHCLCVQAQQTPIRIMILDWSLLGASEPLSGRLGLWNRTRDDSSDTCHSFLAPSCLSAAPENCSDGPMIYLTHADVFCIKAA